ncbi:enoyl-CoA hydratase-related protein [uncultured Thiothrix sp.]|uniref:enoyl-CoA hydratase-related protein n=1 Tax=uncultured Thiothrix sp. TaxID=223185 RepID=UPI00263985C7|nr:enoyl-CoA hydratase-related protein [uncultured Thiothrix sp.]
MEFETILLETPEAGIYCLTINRPAQYNALNAKTLEEIHAAATHLQTQADARVLLLTGSGQKAFAAGADIKEMQSKSAIEGQAFGRKGMQAFRSLELLPIPVIAVVHGFALGGGCELAMSCDWIIASEQAQFGQPEVALGVTPGFGGTQRLSRLVGRSKALELLVSGRRIDAATALAWGLVNHVYPVDDLMKEALKIAREIAAQAPLAVQMCKQLVIRGQDLELATACLLEEQAFGLSFSTQDQKEGMAAFVEKRTALFRGV